MRLTHTDRVLYSPGATLSQALVGLAPGTTYILQYHYLVYFDDDEDNERREVLTASIGGEPVDTLIVDAYDSMNGYVERNIMYTATADSATLLFTLTGQSIGNFALDAITLTVACTTDCG